MKILVTGGAGFIGSHVADVFLAAGHEVQVVDDLSHGKRENVPAGARLHVMDIREKALAELVNAERYEVVSHHAAQIDVRQSVEDPMHDASVNVLGSLNLLTACVQGGVKKIIYASSGGAVYGEPEYLPVDESHPIKPVSPYGVSKYVVEQYIEQFGRTHGLRYTILRYPNVYGPRQDALGEAGVISIFSQRMLAGEEVNIFGSGEQERDFVYVGDCARANLLALEKGDGEVMNLGTGSGITINSLFRVMAGETGYTRQPVYRPPRQGETFRMAVDASRARAVMGWRPEVELLEGLRRTIASMREKTASC